MAYALAPLRPVSEWQMTNGDGLLGLVLFIHICKLHEGVLVPTFLDTYHFNPRCNFLGALLSLTTITQRPVSP